MHDDCKNQLNPSYLISLEQFDQNTTYNMRLMTLHRFRLLAFTICVSFSELAHAQSTSQTTESPTQVETPKIKTLPPAYEPQMLRLSEILGSLHYLRELCNANEGQKWRQAMQDMIQNEEPSEDRRAQMIANFNHGFRGFQETYRECTSSAIEANNRYMSEGIKLSGEIPTRYGR